MSEDRTRGSGDIPASVVARWSLKAALSGAALALVLALFYLYLRS